MEFGSTMIRQGCESYIAPNKAVYYNDAILFSLLVYNHIFFESSSQKPNLKTINSAFDKAVKKYEKGSFNYIQSNVFQTLNQILTFSRMIQKCDYKSSINGKNGFN